MGDAPAPRGADLGEVAPARSRHAGRRSAVALAGDLAVVGTADGGVRAHDRTGLDARWRAPPDDGPAAVVSVTAAGGCVAVGERGPRGAVRLHDAATGRRRWRYDTAADVGPPRKSARLFRPFVVDLAADGDRLYVASRRYERDGGGRSFESVVAAFDLDGGGDVAWRYETDASPIALDARGDRVAVAYNRCPGAHGRGLVVLDAGTGAERYAWDPGTDGDRRVGDVSLVDGGVALASHGDYRGYRLRHGGEEAWAVDLATPTAVGDETLYAYPNHVHATAEGVVFVTGNTYPAEGRETASLHPREHTVFGYTPDGEPAWRAPVGGFANELGAGGGRVAVPGAQHFRVRDADGHGLRLFDPAAGPETSLGTDGILTAVALDGDGFATVEEPVVYHDEGIERGAYRLLVGSIPSGSAPAPAPSDHGKRLGRPDGP